MAPREKTEYFKKMIETRIAEAQRLLANAQQETRVASSRQADSSDQATAEFERQALVHKAQVAQQTLKTLQKALESINSGTYGQCVQCGVPIETKRLEAIPWARYCLACQEASEHR